MIGEAAAKSATLNTLHLQFFYEKKGFMILANNPLQLGQRYPCSTEIDVRDVLSVEKTA